jgi:hypothetical protein
MPPRKYPKYASQLIPAIVNNKESSSVGLALPRQTSYSDQQNLKKRKESECSSNEIQGLKAIKRKSYENNHVVNKRKGEDVVEADDDNEENQNAARLFEIDKNQRQDAFDASINALDPVSDSTDLNSSFSSVGSAISSTSSSRVEQIITISSKSLQYEDVQIGMNHSFSLYFFIFFLGRLSEKVLRSKPSFQEHYKRMRGLKTQKYRIYLSNGLEMALNEHIELLKILFLTLLAESPTDHAINVTVKYFGRMFNSLLTIYN